MKSTSFWDDLAWSQTPAIESKITDILRQRFPAALAITKSSVQLDKLGSDFQVVLPNRILHVDSKIRSRDYGDVILEAWSNRETKKKGWTIDTGKITDYILFYWEDTRRFAFIDFQDMQAAFYLRGKNWLHRFKTTEHRTGRAVSIGVAVPVDEIYTAIREWNEGISE